MAPRPAAPHGKNAPEWTIVIALPLPCFPCIILLKKPIALKDLQ
jgi:hypothetical protein